MGTIKFDTVATTEVGVAVNVLVVGGKRSKVASVAQEEITQVLTLAQPLVCTTVSAAMCGQANALSLKAESSLLLSVLSFSLDY